LPIKESDIEKEILRAQEDRDYVLAMRVHDGARRLLTEIHKLHRVVVITARKGDAATKWTAEWLLRYGLPYDEVIASSEAKKGDHRTDVLIDDFIGNISEFLTNTKGIAVLVDQPWNRTRSNLDAHVAAGRLLVVSDLLELRSSWHGIAAKARAAKAAGDRTRSS
jgi:5'(3')-deoxyribonucleotidase